jgi:hypothetical protein
VPLSALVIVRVVGRRVFDGASSKGHDGDGVGDDGDSTSRDEGVGGELSVEVLKRKKGSKGVSQRQVARRKERERRWAYGVSSVVRVNGDGGISEHSLRTSGSDDDLLLYSKNDCRASQPLVYGHTSGERRTRTSSLDLVSEAGDGSELKLFLGVVARDGKHRTSSEGLLVDLYKTPRWISSRNGIGFRREGMKQRSKEDEPRGWREWCSS